MTSSPRQSFVLLSQVYVPDPAAVGQYIADVATELAARGHRVVVYASRNGYDDPSVVYPSREVRDGVEIIRLPFSSFGKSSIAIRLAAGFSFLCQALSRILFSASFDVLLVSTSPPTAPLVGLLVRTLRQCRLCYWVMDINPDQLLAQRRVDENSPAVRLFNAMQRAIMRRADVTITLDRFMADSLLRKVNISERMQIVALWPLADQSAEPVARESGVFRKAHGLDNNRVVMYSGNHTRSNPLETLVEAALRMEPESGLAFAFVGGGEAKPDIDAIRSPLFHSFPYQPIETLADSLSAADVHVVSIGTEMVGILHPCKIYGAMAVGRPVLILGPARSHLGDILAEGDLGWQVDHGDVEGMLRILRVIAALPEEELCSRGRRARELIDSNFSRAKLCGRFCDILETQAMVKQ